MRELFDRIWTDLDVGLLVLLPFLGFLAAVGMTWQSEGRITAAAIAGAASQWILSMVGGLRGLRAEPLKRPPATPPIGPTLILVILAYAIVAGAGCATLPEGGRARCDALAERYQTWGGVSAFAASLAGGGAIGTALPNEVETRLVAGISTAVMGGVAVAARFIRDDNYDLYAGAGCELELEPADTSTASGLADPHDPLAE
jgi:hypothetical protein